MGCTVTASVVGHLLPATAWTIVVVLKHKRCVSLAGTVAHNSSTRLHLRADISLHFERRKTTITRYVAHSFQSPLVVLV